MDNETSSVKVACVTGASGVIGRRVVEALLDKSYIVRVLTRENVYPYSANVDVHTGDILNLELLQEFIKHAEIMFHCAGEVRDEARMWQVNVNGMQMLLDACQGSSLKHFCYISSAGVIGSADSKIITESSSCNPRNAYEKSKWHAEQLVSNIKSNISMVCLRPTNVVDDSYSGAIEFTLCASFMNMCKTLIKGNECAHVVHAIDVANAAIHLSSITFEKPESYFVSCDDDKLNSYAGIWSLFRSMENHKKFPTISPFICMPVALLHLARSIFGRRAIKGNVKFSSEKLNNTGFYYKVSLKDIVSRMLKVKNENTKCK